MGPNRFERAEQEYRSLKRQLAAGEITRAEFLDTLAGLRMRDALGRVWMINPDSGKWYVQDTPSAAAVPSEFVEEEPSEVYPRPRRNSVGTFFLRLLAAVVILLLLIFDGAGLLMLKRNGGFGSSLPASFAAIPGFGRPTVDLAEGSVAGPTPSPQASPTAPTRGTATPASTPRPPTSSASSSTIPTALPLNTAAATGTPLATMLPYNLYVSALRTNPPSPKRGQTITFLVTFLNTTSSSLTTRWTVYIFTPDNARNAVGQTSSSAVFQIPPGTTEISAFGDWRITGSGPCENFIARVAWLNESRAPTFFLRPNGQVFEQPFVLCP